MNRLTLTARLRTVSTLGLWIGLGSLAPMAQAPPANTAPPPSAPRPVPTLPPPIAVTVSPTGAIMDANNLPLRVMGGGIFELANVVMDKPKRSVSFPAVVNMDQGPMEYFLVTSYGKVHESILRTDTLPYHLHVAMLLLDVKDGRNTTVAGSDKPAAGEGQGGSKGRAPTISTPDSEILHGDKLVIEVTWTVDGKETTRRAEELVSNVEKKTTLPKGSWVYNGSEVIGGTFQAQLSGSLVSLITDRFSLINSIAPGHDNDDIWAVNTNSLPSVNTPVRVTLRVEGTPPK